MEILLRCPKIKNLLLLVVVVSGALWQVMFVYRLLINVEAIFCFPEEVNKKSSRKPVYENWYFGLLTP